MASTRFLKAFDALHSAIIDAVACPGATDVLAEFFQTENCVFNNWPNDGFCTVLTDFLKDADREELDVSVGLLLAQTCFGLGTPSTSDFDGDEQGVSQSEKKVVVKIIRPLLNRWHAKHLERYQCYYELEPVDYFNFVCFLRDDLEPFGESSDTCDLGEYLSIFAEFWSGAPVLDSFEALLKVMWGDMCRLCRGDPDDPSLRLKLLPVRWLRESIRNKFTPVPGRLPRGFVVGRPTTSANRVALPTAKAQAEAVAATTGEIVQAFDELHSQISRASSQLARQAQSIEALTDEDDHDAILVPDLIGEATFDTYLGLTIAANCLQWTLLITQNDTEYATSARPIPTDKHAQVARFIRPLINRWHGKYLGRYLGGYNLASIRYTEFVEVFTHDTRPFGGASDIGTIGWLVKFVSLAVSTGAHGVCQTLERLVSTVVRMTFKTLGKPVAEPKVLKDLRKNVLELEKMISQASNQNVDGATSAARDSRVGDPPRGSDADRRKTLDEATEELQALVGLDTVKLEVQRLMNFLAVQQEREKLGLPRSSQTLHYVFYGNPGTGKTTVARILSRVFFGFGTLNSAKLVECDRADLVGGYLGQTAIKTDEVIQRALDGVLFIDEAYNLAGDAAKFGHGDMYGEEAINTLLKRMEDCRDRLIVIVAGYPELMQRFLKTNPGLQSRFTRFIQFEDYDVAALCQIFERLCEKNQYRLSQSCRGKMSVLFSAAHQQRNERFGNARFVRNVFENAQHQQSERLVKTNRMDKESLTTFEQEDISIAEFTLPNDAELRLEDYLWVAHCPNCQKRCTASFEKIGRAVCCTCGEQFVFPWWRPTRRVGA